MVQRMRPTPGSVPGGEVWFEFQVISFGNLPFSLIAPSLLPGNALGSRTEEWVLYRVFPDTYTHVRSC